MCSSAQQTTCATVFARNFTTVVGSIADTLVLLKPVLYSIMYDSNPMNCCSGQDETCVFAISWNLRDNLRMSLITKYDVTCQSILKV